MRTAYALLGAAVTGVIGLAPHEARAQAQVLVHESAGGHEVRVARAADGALSLSVGVGAPVALGAGTANTHATIERVSVGSGGAVLIVRTTEPATAALLGVPAGRPPAVLFSGPLAPRGELGEQRTTEILARDLTGSGVPSVVVGERDERLRLCGVGMPLVSARVVDPATMQLRSVAINPLREDLHGTMPPARAVNAAPVAPTFEPSPAEIAFNARFANGQVGDPTAVLHDRSAGTTWAGREREFVSATVSTGGFAVSRVVLTAPPAPAVLPSTMTLLLGPSRTRLDVSVPALPATAPGARVAIPIVPGVPLECLSIVVTSRSDAQHPAAIAEVSLESEAGTGANAIAALVRALAGPSADQAAALLAASGPEGIEALATALPTLERTAALRAVRVLGAARTERAATALVGALGRTELADEARAALRRMGPSALAPLAATAALDARAAELIVALPAPLEGRMRALLPLLAADRPVYHAGRRAALLLLREAAGTGDGIARWLALLPADGTAQIRGLVVAAEAARDDAQRALIAARARQVHTDAFADRYRLVLPLAGDAEGRAELAHIAADDPEPDLRAEAVAALARSGDADAALVQALGDEVPRVRAAAARALAGRPTGRAALLEHLAHDSWPSVRAEAATALSGDASAADALVRALDDPSLVTVRAALTALSHTSSPAVAPALLRFAESSQRNPELRRDALGALADRCERSVLERVERLATSLTDPALPPPEQEVGHAALAAVAHIDPARARALFANMHANEFATAAMERAMRNACPAP